MAGTVPSSFHIPHPVPTLPAKHAETLPLRAGPGGRSPVCGSLAVTPLEDRLGCGSGAVRVTGPASPAACLLLASGSWQLQPLPPCPPRPVFPLLFLECDGPNWELEKFQVETQLQSFADLNMKNSVHHHNHFLPLTNAVCS